MITTIVTVSFIVALVAMLAAAVYRERDLKRDALNALSGRVAELEHRAGNHRRTLDHITERLYRLEQPKAASSVTTTAAVNGATYQIGSDAGDYWTARIPIAGLVPESAPAPTPRKAAPRKHKRQAATRGKHRKATA